MTKEEFEKHYMVVGEHVYSAGLFQLYDHESTPKLDNELMGEEDFDTDYYAIIKTDDDGLFEDTIDDSFKTATEAWEAYDKLMEEKVGKETPTNPYELTLLLRAGRLPRAAVNIVEGKIMNLGGKVIKTHDDGIKTLAYPIQHEQRAQYYYLDIELPDGKPVELSSWMNTNEDLLRYLLVKSPKKTEENQ